MCGCVLCITYTIIAGCLQQARERKHLRDFLAEYDDEKDDQKYYK